MESFFTLTNLISVVSFVVFFIYQIKFYKGTKKSREIFENFFAKNGNYAVQVKDNDGDPYPEIVDVSNSGSDLGNLIKEINTYLFKTI